MARGLGVRRGTRGAPLAIVEAVTIEVALRPALVRLLAGRGIDLDVVELDRGVPVVMSFYLIPPRELLRTVVLTLLRGVTLHSRTVSAPGPMSTCPALVYPQVLLRLLMHSKMHMPSSPRKVTTV